MGKERLLQEKELPIPACAFLSGLAAGKLLQVLFRRHMQNEELITMWIGLRDAYGHDGLASLAWGGFLCLFTSV